jgi:hypothetical protein
MAKDVFWANVFSIPTDTIVSIGYRARERWFCGMSDGEIVHTVTRWALAAEMAGVRLKAIRG